MLIDLPAETLFPAAFTVDLEEWYHVCGVVCNAEQRKETRVVAATERILQLLEQHQVKGTFFMLGEVMEQHPKLAPQIAARGHELASHGWSHTLVTRLTPGQFRDELLKTSELMQIQTGIRPIGFRAPQWSLSRTTTPWAFDILAELGYCYDSSLTPLPFIGNRKGSRKPSMISTTAGNLWEIPPLVTPSPLGNLPTGGGWGFRSFPFSMIEKSMRQMAENNSPAVLFVHPRELDRGGPRLPLGLLRNFITYGSTETSTARLEQLLRRFNFTTMREIVTRCQKSVS